MYENREPGIDGIVKSKFNPMVRSKPNIEKDNKWKKRAKIRINEFSGKRNPHYLSWLREKS